ncbi:DNA cytosine methyltransferase [Streptomyces sp. NPDC008240]|uniref:DNA cytosine methyltransferase n=1 Tax=Streptomyces sp. NPDC008240 TaxID=3364822 RepID=UPI0036E522FD
MIDAIHLFAGPGGLECGALAEGVDGTGIEWDAHTVATRVAAGLATTHGDVTQYGPRDFPRATVLTAGPPCQTISIAGKGSGRAELDQIVTAVKLMGAGDHVDKSMFADPRTALILEPLRWAIEDFECGYNAIVLEQVPQALPVWEAYAEVLRSEGYSVATGVLRTEQYGVPQTRRRAVLVARLVGEAKLPEPTHRAYRKGVPQHEGDPQLKPWISMGESLPDRGPFTVISNYGTGGDPKNRGRRTSSEPAFTVTGKISRLRLVDPDGRELPRLTPTEAGQLQGFPADYPWSGGDIAQQIGNACPVQLAAALIRAATR